MTYTDERPCALGGRVVIQPVPGGFIVGHEPSGGHMGAGGYDEARRVMLGVCRATTLADADTFAPILPRGTVDLIDVFMADPENEPSPAGIAARRAMFRG